MESEEEKKPVGRPKALKNQLKLGAVIEGKLITPGEEHPFRISINNISGKRPPSENPYVYTMKHIMAGLKRAYGRRVKLGGDDIP